MSASLTECKSRDLSAPVMFTEMIPQAQPISEIKIKKSTILMKNADELALECTHFLQEEVPWVQTGVGYTRVTLSDTPC